MEKLLNFLGLTTLNKSQQKVNEVMQQSQSDLDKLNGELSVYKKLIKDIYIYSGSYPIWKLQQEYRRLLKENDIALTDRFAKKPYQYPDVASRAEYIDIYLCKLVDSFAAAIRKWELDFVNEIHFWSEEHLPQARGDELLQNAIKAKAIQK